LNRNKREELEAQIAHLGQIQPQIPRQLFTDIMLGLLKNFSEEIHDEDAPKEVLLGQIMTITTFIGTSSINEQTKMEAHSLLHQATEWAKGHHTPEQLHHSIDLLIHDLSLLIG